MHESQMDYQFEEQLPGGHAYLTKVTDRSGNAMTSDLLGDDPSGTPKLDHR